MKIFKRYRALLAAFVCIVLLAVGCSTITPQGGASDSEINNLDDIALFENVQPKQSTETSSENAQAASNFLKLLNILHCRAYQQDEIFYICPNSGYTLKYILEDFSYNPLVLTGFEEPLSLFDQRFIAQNYTTKQILNEQKRLLDLYKIPEGVFTPDTSLLQE